MDFEGLVAILGALVGLPWLILHYVTKWKTAPKITDEDELLLDEMQLSEILSVEEDGAFTRPIYAGNAIATVRSKDAKKVITVRTTGFDNAAAEGGSGTIEKIDAGAHLGGSDFVGSFASTTWRPAVRPLRMSTEGRSHG